MSALKSVVWYITEACGNRCPYCFFVQSEKTPAPFIDSEKWVEAWNRLKPERLDITGGEPFFQPGFLALLEGLDDSIHVAITTSLQKVPLENSYALFAQRISPKKVDSMTISYHPSCQEWAQWKGKALLLKNRGFSLTCNFVGFPEQMYLIPSVKKDVEEMGIRFHLDPYWPGPKIPFEPTAEEKAYLMGFTGADRTLTLNRDEVQHKPCFCDAGMTHIQVAPDGTAKRCGTLGASIGNILDPIFKLFDEAGQCDCPWMCQSCDRDKTQPSWRFLE